MARQESRTCYIHKLLKHIKKKLKMDLQPCGERASCHHVCTSPFDHYYISAQSRTTLNLSTWLHKHTKDCAIKVSMLAPHVLLMAQKHTQNFHVHLKDHMLACLQGVQHLREDLAFSDEEHNQVLISKDKIFVHKVLQVNYTTYDLQHKQNSITTRHPNVIVLSQETDEARHPYFPCQCALLWQQQQQRRSEAIQCALYALVWTCH